MRLYPRGYKWLWHSRGHVHTAQPMNLVVASRHEGPLMRFDVEGSWQNGDALKLAYMVKAAVARLRQDHVLIWYPHPTGSPATGGRPASTRAPTSGCSAPHATRWTGSS